jgi:hypothetical protein
MLVRQYRIKIFNEAPVTAMRAAKIIAPRIQAEREQVLE